MEEKIIFSEYKKSESKDNIIQLYWWLLQIYTPFLIGVGILIGLLLPKKGKSSIIFIFPFYHVGGAEKVHSDIVKCFSKLKPLVIFLEQSKNSKFLHLFDENAEIIDNSKIRRNAFLYKHILVFLYLGYLVPFINRQEHPILFGSNSLHFYFCLPYLKSSVIRMDLTHAFGGGLENKTRHYIKYLNARIVINKKTFYDFKLQYQKCGISSEYLTRIHCIPNAITLLAKPAKKTRREKIRVLYVGRGDEEKRVHLVGKIARLCKERGISSTFTLVGDTIQAIEQGDRKYCINVGELSDPNEIAKYYLESDILILTSRYEGFPIVIMEAMSFGTIVLSTDVGGIAEHISHNKNGILVPNRSENEIVEDMVHFIQKISFERELLDLMSKNANEYAQKTFNMKNFCESYFNLFSNLL